MTNQLKQQLKHSEKNVIDLEDSSDFDSQSDAMDTDEIEITDKTLKDAPPVTAVTVLKKVTKAYQNRPS